MRPSSRAPLSIFGGIGYPPSHPSRWAGVETVGTARLTVEDDCVVIAPLGSWRWLLRMPALRIPLTEVQRASRIRWGLKFSVPGNPALDGTRFKHWLGGGRELETLIELLAGRGITVQPMPRTERVRGFVSDYAVAQRPGWIWRDRGWLGFAESAVALGVVLVGGFLIGFFADLPRVMLLWLAFIVAVIVWGWFAGHRRRKNVTR